MKRRVICHFLALGILFPGLARDVSVGADGTLLLAPDVTLRPLVAAPGWKGSGKGWATAKTSVEEQPSGQLAVTMRFVVHRDAPEGLGALGFSVDVPRAAVDGRLWCADARKGTFRAGNCIRPLGTGRAHSFQMPLEGGKSLSFVSEQLLGYYIQDNAAQGNGKTVTMRLGDVDAPLVVTNGQVVAYSAMVAVVEPLETPWTRPFVIKRSQEWLPIDFRRDVIKDSALDFSRFGALDAPAGCHGWLRAEGDRFAFENRPRVPVRFYGVNLCFEACFPEDAAAAERLVVRLRRQGYNSIRLHHHDRILTETSVDGVSLDPRRADQLDMLVAAAVRHGMYITTDLFVSREVKYRQIGIDRIGVINQQVFKSLVDLYEPAFQNWAAFAKNFLEHVNPYTSRAYKDEPAMPLISVVNEGGLFMGWWYSGKKTEPVIVEAWRKWVEEKRRANPEFHPEVSADVVPATPYDGKYSGAFALFQADVEAAGFAKKRDFLRSLGVKALLTSDNTGPHWASLQATTGPLDYIDDHFYQDHPQFVDKMWQMPSRAGQKCCNPVLDNRLQCCTSPYTRMAGKPFTVTEFSFSAPSPYRSQGGLLAGALAGLQDWSGLWHFAHEGLRNEADTAGRVRYFSVDGDPMKIAADRAVLALFLRGDMQPFPKEKGVSLLITPDAVDPKGTAAFYSYPKWMADACWKRRTSSCFDRASAGTQTVIPRECADEQGMKRMATEVPSDPRIAFDRKAGSFAVSTPRTAGGFAGAGQSLDAGFLRADVAGAPATVWATSLDGLSLDVSRRILLTHLTDAQNEGAMFTDASFVELQDWGRSALVRAGSAEISLACVDAVACRVYSLRMDGSRKGEVPSRVHDGRLLVRLEIAGDDPTLHYEIEK